MPPEHVSARSTMHSKLTNTPRKENVILQHDQIYVRGSVFLS